MTYGEQRVRLSFNPGNNDAVTAIKKSAAALIDMCQELSTKDPISASNAQKAFEEAAMWAVKAATA